MNNTNDDIILNINNFLTKKGSFNTRCMDEALREKIISLTSFMHQNEKMSVRCYFLVNKIDPIKSKCEYCANVLYFGQVTHNETPLRRYCNLTCSNSDHKKHRQKRDNTCLKKYGVTDPNKLNSIKLKVQHAKSKTVKERYGVDNVFQVESVKEKIKQSYKLKYGVNHPMQLSKIRQKQQDTMSIKYGVDNFSHTHIPEESLTILNSKNNLASLFNKHGLTQCMSILGITEMTMRKYLYSHNIISPYYNMYQDFIYAILDELSIDYKKNDRTVIGPKELDIYIPEFNLGIEINGVYWHSDLYKKPNYHQMKYNLTKNNGIKLLQFWSTQIDKTPDIVKSIIKHNLNRSIIRLYAKKCNINEISSADYYEFLTQTHLQGGITSKVKLGLFFENKLVSVMGFSKARYSKNVEYELIRFATANNTAIAGAASKLFKYFVKTYNPDSIISYANMDISQGKLYQTIGFNFSHVSKPGFYYTKGSDMISRLKFQKHKLQTILKSYDPSISPSVNIQNNGYNKVYDAGNSVWIWNK